MLRIFHYMHSWAVRYGAYTVTKCMALGVAGLMAWPQTVSAADVATTPQPWNGQRHKSCDVYHSSKYKKNLYDSAAINDYLIRVLGVDNTPKLFYRWERPVRYYLEVPPEAPQLAKEFEAQLAQIAKYTGLDMARHDKPYMEYKDPKRNDKSQWPGGLSTNVIFHITTDVSKTVQDPFVSELLRGFGVTPERELAGWSPLVKYRSARYGHDPDGMKFVLMIRDQIYSVNLSKQKESQKIDLLQAGFLLTTVMQNTQAGVIAATQPALSELSQQFLRVLYGPHVHSGMLLIKAKRLMMEELIDCFNTKGA